MNHPGTIRITEVGLAGERVIDANTVPRIAFADDGGAQVPVVHLEHAMSGQRRVIRSYGVDGKLLMTTWQA